MIQLRKLTLKNATKEYCNWLNDKEVNRYLETRKATINSLKKFINDKNKKKDCLLFGIFHKEKHIGNVKLEPINYKEKTAELGILIGNKGYWNKGYGTKVMNLIINHAFNNLKLDKITLGVKANNKNAIKLYERVKFKTNTLRMELVRTSHKQRSAK